MCLCQFLQTGISILFCISSLFLPVFLKPSVFKVCPQVRCVSNVMAWYSLLSRSVSPVQSPWGRHRPHCLQLLTTTNTTMNILAPVPLWTWDLPQWHSRLPSGTLGQSSLPPAGPPGAHLPTTLPTLSTTQLSNLHWWRGQLCFDSHFSDYFLRILFSLWVSSLVDHVYILAVCPATHMMPCLK